MSRFTPRCYFVVIGVFILAGIFALSAADEDLSTHRVPSNAFTPFTVPSSRPQLGGGVPAHITNIRQHQDGRVSFMICHEYE
jgi:hypothetical protein